MKPRALSFPPHLGRVTLLFICLMAAFTVTFKASAQGDPTVLLQTTKGPIAIRVFTRMVPNTSASFLDLVSRGWYNGLTFHRVENWVIQAGDPHANGTGVYVDPATGQPRYLSLETNRYLRHNAPGVVAMAHGPSVNSGSCQFYITKKATPALDGSYSIFGGVVQGMDTVYNIQRGDRIISSQIIGQGVTRPRPVEPEGGGGGGGPNQGPAPDSGF